MTQRTQQPLIGGRVMRKDRYFAETGYFPHPSQQQVHFDNHRHKVLCNGRRWGKTLLGGKEAEPMAFIKNRLGEPQLGWIVGPLFSDCEKEFRVVYNTFRELGIEQVSSKFLNNPDNGNMHIKTRWGFELECRSALHPETLTGEGLDFVLMVEAGKHKRKTWTEYIRPALSDKRGWSLHTGVPEGSTQTSLLYFLWNRGQSQTVSRTGRDREAVAVRNPWKSWRMPSWTNTIVFPGGRHDPEILDAEADLTEEEFDRQYGAKFVDKVGRVMKDWDDDLHLADLDYNREWPLYLAIDYGWTNPFVILFIQVDAWNNVYVIREKLFREKDTEDIAKETFADPVLGPLIRKAVCIYPDPAEPDDTNTLKKHWKKQARTNTGGTIQSRLKLIWRGLKVQNQHLPDGHVDKRPSLFVDRYNCPNLVWEMREAYRWPEHRSEVKNNDENPLDKDNHGCEALGRFYAGYMGIIEPERRTTQSTAKVKRGA